MKTFAMLFAILISSFLMAQNIGIGIANPLRKLHIANGTTGNVNPLGPLVVESNSNTYITLLAPNANESAVSFAKASDAFSGSLIYNNAATPNGFQLRANGNSIKMVIDQNGQVGIGTTTPSAKLEVNGQVKLQSLVINGGTMSDFLIISDPTGLVGYRQGYTGLGLNYMIALTGSYPANGAPFINTTYVGEIKLFSGSTPPFGWAFCNGQLLLISSYMNLFSLIGTTYGGDGVITFALPDLRDAIPVHPGGNWVLGQTSN